jgi:hypothetical protein
MRTICAYLLLPEVSCNQRSLGEFQLTIRYYGQVSGLIDLASRDSDGHEEQALTREILGERLTEEKNEQLD